MKILCELKNIDLINDLLNVDGLIVNTDYSISPNPIYNDSFDKIIKWSKDNNKELIFRIDKIITEYEVEEIVKFIDKYKEYNFIYTDFAIFTYCKRNNLLDHLYYFAQTYLVNYEDIKYYTSLGVKCLMSNELSLEEINTIIDKNDKNLGLLVYGYFPIFYTKRELVSLYKDNCINNGVEINLNKNQVYDLKEELREDLYKIEETKNGTIIYSCKKMFVNKQIDLEKLDFVYLSNCFLGDKEIKEVINYYYQYKNGNILEEEFNDTFTSFLYKTNEIL